LSKSVILLEMESFIVVVVHSKHKTKISQTKRCNAAAICCCFLLSLFLYIF